MLVNVLYCTALAVLTYVLYESTIGIVRRKRRKERTDRAVKDILDQYAREAYYRAAMEPECEVEIVNKSNVINVDFVEIKSEETDARDWKLVYNRKLDVYQKVPR